jgi:hypothetical protein
MQKIISEIQPRGVRGITAPCKSFSKSSTSLLFILLSSFKETEGNTTDVGDESRTVFKCLRSIPGLAAKSSILNYTENQVMK